MDDVKRDSSPCRYSLAAGLLLAVLAAAATAAQLGAGAAPLRLFQPGMFPGPALPSLLQAACTTSNLHGLVEDGEFTWGCGAAICNLAAPASNATAAAAVQHPPWQAPSLQLTRCKLRRFTPEAARECLEGRPLVMIGDSLTRYQYIALIYFLEFGRWPAPLRGAAGDPSPVIASEWGPWSQFYQGTTTMFAGHQQCRCFRQDAFNAPEDRFYRNGNLSMTFYRWLGYPLTPLAGHWGFPPFSNATKCQPGACSADPDWQLPIQDGIREVIAKLKPHTLVLNAGLWRRNRTDWPTELYDSIFQAGIKAVAPQGGQCVWKTTTLAQAGDLKVGRDRDAAAVAAAQRHGWLVSDAWGATHAAKMQLGDGIYIDPAHYKGFVYTELNQLLLNTICPAHN